MTMQAGMTKVGELASSRAINRTLREVFPVVAGYQTFISCFGTPWGFITRHQEGRSHPAGSPPTIDRLIAERIKGPLAYWDGQTHQHSFNLPQAHPGGHRRADPRRHRRQPADRHVEVDAVLVLASASPRRRELLSSLGSAFQVAPQPTSRKP